MSFVWDEAALERVLEAIAGGVDDWAQDAAVPAVVARAPSKKGRYRRTIHAATFYRNRLVGRGAPVRGKLVKSKAEIWTLVYTSSKLGHLLEFGTQAHDIPITVERGAFASRIIRHPGSRRFPHFGVGILAARNGIGVTIRAGTKKRLGR